MSKYGAGRERELLTDQKRRGFHGPLSAEHATGWKSRWRLEAANAAAGMHWFSKDSTRFFKTLIHGDMVGGRYFITSEQGPHGPRFFQIREAHDDASIRTVGAPELFGDLAGLHGYRTLALARRALSLLIAAADTDAHKVKR